MRKNVLTQELGVNGTVILSVKVPIAAIFYHSRIFKRFGMAKFYPFSRINKHRIFHFPEHICFFFLTLD